MKNEVDILLIEDNMNDAELAIRALEKHHLVNQLVHLKDGAEALDFIFAEGAFNHRDKTVIPKVILLDLKMPKVNGMEVLKKLKNDDFFKKIPIVILTSSKEDPDIQNCYDLGANSFIVKPVKFDEFVKVVSELGLYWMILNQPPC